MKSFLTVLKWEGRKTFHLILPLGIIAVIAVAAVTLLPIPQETWVSPLRTAVIVMFVLAGCSALFLGFIFLVLYPTYNLAVKEITDKELLLRRGSGFPYSYRVIARIGLNVLVAAAGLAIIGFVLSDNAMGRLYPSDIPIIEAMANASAGASFVDFVTTPMRNWFFPVAVIVIIMPAVFLYMFTFLRFVVRKDIKANKAEILLVFSGWFIVLFLGYLPNEATPFAIYMLLWLTFPLGLIIAVCWAQDKHIQVVVK